MVHGRKIPTKKENANLLKIIIIYYIIFYMFISTLISSVFSLVFAFSIPVIVVLMLMISHTKEK
jgi:hypothetical protein